MEDEDKILVVVVVGIGVVRRVVGSIEEEDEFLVVVGMVGRVMV